MSTLLKISDGAALAIHSMILMAKFNDRLLSNQEMATILRASSHHLSKVLQRLARAGLVQSVRGPSGGFRLIREPGSITFMEVFEAVDGPMRLGTCLFSKPLCDGSSCVMGELLGKINRLFVDHMQGKVLSDLVGAYDCVEVD